MTTEREQDRRVAAWLHQEADPIPAPDYLEETLALLAATHQRRWLRAVPAVAVADRPRVSVDRRIVRLALVAALTIAALAASLWAGSRPRPAPPIGPAGNGLLAIGDGVELLLIDPFDGTVVRRVPPALGTAEYPAFAPDGTHLAYFSRDTARDSAGGPPRHLFVAPTDLSGPVVEVTDGRAAWEDGEPFPAWSPDGTEIAFTALDIASNISGIYATSLKGEGSRLVVGLDGIERGFIAQPRWSPDGRWISYRGDTGRPGVEGFLDTSLKIVPAAAGPPKLLATTTGRSSSFSDHSWAPDSRRIAYSRRASDTLGDYLVAVYDLEGATEEVISPDGVRGYRPAWSPDGRSIAYFEQRSEGLPDLVVLDLVTRDRIDLGQVADCAFTWSPDGTYIAALEPGCQDDAVLIPVTDRGGDVTRISVPGTASGSISWQRVAP